MAVLRIPGEGRSMEDRASITRYLAERGIDYERWNPSHEIAAGSSHEAILDAYREEIEKLQLRGGYVIADVIDAGPGTLGLDAMLAKFSREHWHDEDEVRFIIEGNGLFHIRPLEGPVFAIQVEPGDLIRVPRGTRHWFDLCADRRIRAIRLFQDPAGWTPHYTDSGADAQFEPVCFGPSFLSPGTARP